MLEARRVSVHPGGPVPEDMIVVREGPQTRHCLSVVARISLPISDGKANKKEFQIRQLNSLVETIFLCSLLIVTKDQMDQTDVKRIVLAQWKYYYVRITGSARMF